MTQGWFIAGTDTGVGKTFCSELLIRQLVGAGHRVAAFKPVASGATLIDGRLRNDDALRLMSAANSGLSYEDINPYCFADPISPHWAAEKAGVTIDIPRLATHVHAKSAGFDFAVAEGVGGWLAPLSGSASAAELAVALRWPVILVVGLRLGCLSHALLTAEAISRSGLTLAGWVANAVNSEYSFTRETVDYLNEHLHSRCLSVVAWCATTTAGAKEAPAWLDLLMNS